MGTVIRQLWRKWRVAFGSLFVIPYSCTFCDYKGTIDMSRMEYEFIGPEQLLRCPKCGLKSLWRRENGD